ncbi:MAG: DUF922 domain-containing Zn-dependent protease [Candidatus Thiodiazotropha sp. (ex. Lucinisca nassula)]|nr:DUF922 domain-containing Zn-dependent protease [Candidatus Thiodiazotropha sp. (ex. Lucinisca nassula)]MBW9260459.1 DUF922 domain-containing Zn-dependent protease [Candidatus Thiodiazotropha sp. (ex. Lucinisca nassula)]MBW9271894.1 DUF922 domain-containing Zn-dependent protease [Candidatus Thiodiazotropha sp. (ex. Lucinisca nassula)]
MTLCLFRISSARYQCDFAMCDTPSPARRNRPVASGANPDTPHAGFTAAQPAGGGTTPQGGPRLSGWPRQLAWSDFTDIQSRPSGESEDATIAMAMHPGRLRFLEEGGQHRLGDVAFQMLLNEAGTWVVASAKTAELLRHEQGHYDIVGLCYRDMVNEIRALRERSRNRLVRAIRRVMSAHDRRADSLTRDYDSAQQTNHGRNSARQQAWNQQIESCRRSGARLSVPD